MGTQGNWKEELVKMFPILRHPEPSEGSCRVARFFLTTTPTVHFTLTFTFTFTFHERNSPERKVKGKVNVKVKKYTEEFLRVCAPPRAPNS